MSSFSRGMELKAQINICIGARQTTEICCHSREGNGIFPISPAASVLGRQIMNGLVVLCAVAPYSLTGAAAACVFSSQHLTTYPFLPSLYLSLSFSFPAREKSPELTLIFLRLRQTTGSGAALTTFCMCANLVFPRAPSTL